MSNKPDASTIPHSPAHPGTMRAAPGPRHPEHTPAQQRAGGPQGMSHAYEGDHHGVGHLVSPKVLITTCLGLLVLTFFTVAATWIDLGEGNIWIALFIAFIKATLVAMFFMHLWWDRPFNAIVLVASFAFVLLFIAFALTDTAEYKPDIINAEPVKIQEKLTALEQAAPAPPLPPAGHPTPEQRSVIPHQQ